MGSVWRIGSWVLLLSTVSSLATGDPGRQIRQLISSSGFVSNRLPAERLAKKFAAIDPARAYQYDYRTAYKTRKKRSRLCELLAYHEGIKTLRQGFAREARSSRLETTETVVYPFFGTDAGFPVRLFPNAKLTIAVDEHVFANKRQTGFASTIPDDRLGYRLATSIRTSNSQGSKVLSNLALSVPGFRLKRLTLFGPRSRPQGNALIEYDTGQGTSPRCFLYVNQRIAKKDRLWSQWWATLMPQGKLGIVIKGAMDRTLHLPLISDLKRQLLDTPRSVAVGASKEMSMHGIEGKRTLVKVHDQLIGYDRDGMHSDHRHTVFLLSNSSSSASGEGPPEALFVE